jgi:hypothetical protein
MKITRKNIRRIIREELSLINETRPRHGIRTGQTIHMRDGRSGRVVAVTKDFILLQSGERVIPSQVDWPRTTGGRQQASALKPPARRPWNWSHGSGKPLPEDWVESYENLKDEISQWFTDRDEASQFLSDVMFSSFEPTARDWEPTMLLGRQGLEKIRQTLEDRGYLNQYGGWKRPDEGGDPDDDSDDAAELRDIASDLESGGGGQER